MAKNSMSIMSTVMHPRSTVVMRRRYYSLRNEECGCQCDSCVNHNSVHLHTEIESLKRQLLERDYHILQMETNFLNHAQRFPNEHEAITDEINYWRDKYERLYDSHKKTQKVNQGLEDKLLKIVDKFESEKSALTADVADLTTKLVETRVALSDLEDENEKYRNDCSVAIQLLQCKPSNFVSHRLSTLPVDLQSKVRDHIGYNKRSNSSANVVHEPKVIRVPIPTFPPTAMVYSVNAQDEADQKIKNKPVQPHPDLVSAAIMAKVLEERAKERNDRQSAYICASCRNHRKRSGFSSLDYVDKCTQTDWWTNERRTSSCDTNSTSSSCSSSCRNNYCDSSTNTDYRCLMSKTLQVRNGSANSTETAI